MFTLAKRLTKTFTINLTNLKTTITHHHPLTQLCYPNKFSFSNISFFETQDALGNAEIESVLFHYSRGDKFWSESQLEKAIEEYHQVLKLVLNSNGLSFIDLNTVYKNLGNIYFNQGDFQESIKSYEKSLSIVAKEFGDRHFQVGHSLKLLANAYIQQSEWDKALEYSHKALSIFKENFEEDDVYLAESYYDFGLIYQNQCEWDLALQHYQKALEIYGLEEEAWNQLAELQNNIGHIYCKLGDLENAVQSYWKSMEICKKHFGNESVKVGFNYNNLGGLLYEKKEFGEAVEYYTKALEVVKAQYGEKNMYVAGVYFNRGNALVKNGQQDEALLDYAKALKIENKLKLKNDQNILDVLNAIAIAYSEREQWGQSLKYHKKALALATQEDIQAGIHYHIGKAYHEQGNAKKALDNFSKTSKTFENDNKKWSSTLHSGQRYYRLGRLGKELMENLQVLSIEGNVENESCKVADYLVDSHQRVAAIYSEHGQLEKTIKVLENVRKMCLKGLEGRKELVGELTKQLGEIYCQNGQKRKGREYLKASKNMNL